MEIALDSGVSPEEENRKKKKKSFDTTLKKVISINIYIFPLVIVLQ